MPRSGKVPPPRTPATDLLRRIESHLAVGRELDLSQGASIEFEDMRTWGVDREVTGEDLCRLLTDPSVTRSPRGIRLRGARIVGGIDLSYRKLDACLHLVSCLVDGEINLIQTELPLLMLRGCHIDRLTGDRMKVGGGALLDYDPKSGERGFRATGLVRLMGAEVGWLSLEGATFRYRGRRVEGTKGEYDSRLSDRPDDDACLRADGLTVNERLTLVSVTAEGDIRLPRTRVGTLIVDETVGRDEPRNLVISDLRYKELMGGPRRSVRQGLRWLNRQTDASFSRQPYWMLASHYEDVGEHSRATFVRFYAAVRRVFPRRTLRSSPGDRVRYWLRNAAQPLTPNFWYGALTGFGYYALASIGWLAATIALVSVLVSGYRSQFVPTRTPVPAAVTTTVRGADPATTLSAHSDTCDASYPCFSPLRYSLDYVVPFASLGQEEYWRPSEVGVPRPVRAGLIGAKLFGWLTATLAAAGITGLLRRA
ncbi:MAG TPA: hypothetical protein VF054_20085 [Micromonosporaceae bacterium]